MRRVRSISGRQVMALASTPASAAKCRMDIGQDRDACKVSASGLTDFSDPPMLMAKENVVK